MRLRPLTTWLATIMAVGLLAAACGDDDDGAAASPGDESPTGETQPVTVEVDEVALQALLDQWRSDVDAYGATLSLRVPGHDDIYVASGIDDRDPETPMPTDGTYGVASITKTFVAAIALQLVDEGRLSKRGSPRSRTPTRSPWPCCWATPPASANGTMMTLPSKTWPGRSVPKRRWPCNCRHRRWGCRASGSPTPTPATRPRGNPAKALRRLFILLTFQLPRQFDAAAIDP